MLALASVLFLCGWFGAVVTAFVTSTKLSYVELG